ncbi:MAG: hypothetical protein M1605_01590 [Candidatus Thermoplasmatota archaeon]|nr:hypothetical protein [Candidatus Thermoplasmatota archaeon]
MVEMERSRTSELVSNIGVMTPSILVFGFVIPYVLTVMTYAVWIPLFSLPFIRLIIPRRFRYLVYRIALLVILSIYIFAELSYTGIIPAPFADPYLFLQLVQIDVIVSLFFSMGFISMIEGIVADRPFGSLGYMLGSLFIFGEQLSAVYLFTSPLYPLIYNQLLPYTRSLPVSFPSSAPTYFGNAYIINYIVQYYAIYTLIFRGAEGVQLPLTVIHNFFDYFVLGGLVISFSSMVWKLYLEGESDDVYRLPGLAIAVIGGVFISLFIIIFIDLFQSIGYQFAALSFLLVGLWLTAGILVRSSSRGKTINI